MDAIQRGMEYMSLYAKKSQNDKKVTDESKWFVLDTHCTSSYEIQYSVELVRFIVMEGCRIALSHESVFKLYFPIFTQRNIFEYVSTQG